jgi:hypothetical protein
VDARALRTLVLLGVIASLVALALYGAHRTLRVAGQRQCAADGGRWDRSEDTCVGARAAPFAPLTR